MTTLLSTSEMYSADAAAMAGGVSGETLMEAAGWQVARAIRGRFTPRPVAVLCGPGNNGGDGFVAARLLEEWGWPVRLALLGEMKKLKGDALRMALRWKGRVEPLSFALLDGAPLVVDALFGAGLERPLDGLARDVIEEIGRRGLDVVAVDVPSGVDGNTGEVLGAAPQARLTVTFFRPKPGHALLPGRVLCGELVLGDIGIPTRVLDTIAPKTFANDPTLWADQLPRPRVDGHKWNRGYLIVVGGGAMTGAARLVAMGARRAGSGLVTILAPDDSLPVYRTCQPGMVAYPLALWEEMIADPHKNAVVIGPGGGIGNSLRRMTLSALAAGKACVIDADALTSFASDPRTLWAAGGTPVLTPHDAEFLRLFHHTGSRLQRARLAAEESGAVVLLKGADTVVAAPDGRASITVNAPPTLATSGTGDVLAGMIGALRAQGMEPFEAASAAAWMHGESAASFGPGFIVEDLVAGLPSIWRRLAAGDYRAWPAGARAQDLTRARKASSSPFN